MEDYQVTWRYGNRKLPLSFPLCVIPFGADARVRVCIPGQRRGQGDTEQGCHGLEHLYAEQRSRVECGLEIAPQWGSLIAP